MTIMQTKQNFPDDENGDVLRQMAEAGIDLVSPRVVDFEHCFPDETSAKRFQEAAGSSVFEAKVSRPVPEESRGWEVQCRVVLVPTHAAITQTELRLGDLARKLGGFPDGWGSLSNPDGSPVE